MAQYYTRQFHTISTHSAAVHCGLKLHEIDVLSTGTFAPPLTRSLTPLTHLLAPHCSLPSRAPLRSFIRSLAHSLPSSWEKYLCQEIERVDFIPFQPTVRHG